MMNSQLNSFQFTYFQNKPLAFEPIDFENFILKNKTLIQNDPQRELLMYPTDDVSVSFAIKEPIELSERSLIESVVEIAASSFAT